MADGDFEIIDQLKNSSALSYCVCLCDIFLSEQRNLYGLSGEWKSGRLHAISAEDSSGVNQYSSHSARRPSLLGSAVCLFSYITSPSPTLEALTTENE
jgi:hypothetical protein